MTATQDETTVDRKARDILASAGVRKHMLIVGAPLFTAGGLTLWLLPELSLSWIVVAVVVVTHIGLLMVIGATALRWLTSRSRPRARS